MSRPRQSLWVESPVRFTLPPGMLAGILGCKGRERAGKDRGYHYVSVTCDSALPSFRETTYQLGVLLATLRSFGIDEVRVTLYEAWTGVADVAESSGLSFPHTYRGVRTVMWSTGSSDGRMILRSVFPRELLVLVVLGILLTVLFPIAVLRWNVAQVKGLPPHVIRWRLRRAALAAAGGPVVILCIVAASVLTETVSFAFLSSLHVHPIFAWLALGVVLWATITVAARQCESVLRSEGDVQSSGKYLVAHLVDLPLGFAVLFLGIIIGRTMCVPPLLLFDACYLVAFMLVTHWQVRDLKSARPPLDSELANRLRSIAAHVRLPHTCFFIMPEHGWPSIAMSVHGNDVYLTESLVRKLSEKALSSLVEPLILLGADAPNLRKTNFNASLPFIVYSILVNFWVLTAGTEHGIQLAVSGLVPALWFTQYVATQRLAFRLDNIAASRLPDLACYASALIRWGRMEEETIHARGLLNTEPTVRERIRRMEKRRWLKPDPSRWEPDPLALC